MVDPDIAAKVEGIDAGQYPRLFSCMVIQDLIHVFSDAEDLVKLTVQNGEHKSVVHIKDGNLTVAVNGWPIWSEPTADFDWDSLDNIEALALNEMANEKRGNA